MTAGYVEMLDRRRSAKRKRGSAQPQVIGRRYSYGVDFSMTPF